MNANLIFYPILLQAFIVIVLYILLGVRKKKAAGAGQVNEERRGLYDDAWPEEVIKVNNCIRNQFEVPVLFYVLVLMLWATGGISITAIVVAWLFAVSRVIHAWIHTGSNYVPLRRKVFTFGCLMVMVLLVLNLLTLFGH